MWTIKPVLSSIVLFLVMMGCSTNTKQNQEENVEKEVSKKPEMTREMCITVDDLPVVGYSNNSPEHLSMITNKLIETFQTYDIPAIGYVNENKLYTKGKLDSTQVDLLERWLSTDRELGNHTYSHMDFHKATVAEYTKDILKGEKITKSLQYKYNQEMRYFRHPYLRIGASKAQHDSLVSFLTEHGYTEAPVTIDNEDYLFALAYHKAFTKKKQADMDSIGKAYVDYMEAKLNYYEAMSIKLFNRNIKQTLLIHASLLNAHYLDDLAKMYRSYGYTFVSQEEVFTDEAYNSSITKYGDWGISWIDRWAMSQGKKGGFFKGDPQTPTFVAKYGE